MEIFQRMKACLAREPQRWPLIPGPRPVVEPLDVNETRLSRRRKLLAQHRDVLRPRGNEVSVHTTEVAIDAFVQRDLLDTIDRGGLARVILSRRLEIA